MTRWRSDAGDVDAWLDTSHRTPRLLVTWPEVAGWRDEGAYAFERVLDPRSSACRIIRAYLGERTLASIVEAVLGARRRAAEEPDMERRTWSRTVCRGFCSGDLDDVESVTVSASGVSGDAYTHSYGQRSDESHWLASAADFVAPNCPYRTLCAECLPRVDEYLGLHTP